MSDERNDGGEFGLGGLSMFDLFRAEAETHTRTLSEGLVALESAPKDLTSIEPLMRAAHSIKGAARIMGLDLAVRLAHAMEDVLVSAQQGREPVQSSRIDQLLAGTDLLNELARLSESDLSTWGEGHARSIDEIVRLLAEPVPDPVCAAESEGAGDVASRGSEACNPAESSGSAADESHGPASLVEPKTVRLAAESVDRMMRLAGEMTIESRRSQATRDPLEALKEQLLDLEETLERLEEEQGGSARLGLARERIRRAVQGAQRHIDAVDEVSRRLEEISTSLYHVALGSRMRPFGEVTAGFPRMVRDLARELGKQVKLEVVGATVAVDRDILARLEAPLNHMLRNAIDHGIELPEEREAQGKEPVARVWIEARHHAGHLLVVVGDDGRGIDPESVRRKVIARGLSAPDVAQRLTNAELLEFLFLPGFSTAETVTEISGRGVGLDVVRTFAQDVGGVNSIDSEPGRGTRFRFELPVSLSVMRAAVVDVGGEPYAFPLARLERVVRVPRSGLSRIEGQRQFMLDGRAVGLVDASAVLELPTSDDQGADELSVMVLAHGRGAAEEWYGLRVDRFNGESDLVVRPLDARLGKVPHVAAASLDEDGAPLLIVDVDDLVQSMRQYVASGKLRDAGSATAQGRSPRKRVLVVDDSLTVREVERQILIRMGYEVDVAVDGADGWNAIRASSFDLLVTDVDMPRMNGLELVASVRREPRLADLPVIVVSYKDREEDRAAGMQAGANVYVSKSAFRDDTFAKAVRNLIGGPEAKR
jgi:two-component system sensor histidine kinase and response regulator WspE